MDTQSCVRTRLINHDSIQVLRTSVFSAVHGHVMSDIEGGASSPYLRIAGETAVGNLPRTQR